MRIKGSSVSIVAGISIVAISGLLVWWSRTENEAFREDPQVFEELMRQVEGEVQTVAPGCKSFAIYEQFGYSHSRDTKVVHTTTVVFHCPPAQVPRAEEKVREIDNLYVAQEHSIGFNVKQVQPNDPEFNDIRNNLLIVSGWRVREPQSPYQHFIVFLD